MDIKRVVSEEVALALVCCYFQQVQKFGIYDHDARVAQILVRPKNAMASAIV